jgi:hypothetical protein
MRLNLSIVHLSPCWYFISLEEHLENYGSYKSGILCVYSSARKDFNYGQPKKEAHYNDGLVLHV